MTFEGIDFKKIRFDSGIVVYNTNNKRYAIVLDGNKGRDDDPCSCVLEQAGNSFMIHTPPNRALLPIGRYVDLKSLIPQLPRVGGESK